MSRLSARLIFTIFVHGIFSQFGDIMTACFNLLNVPIKQFFHKNMLNKFFKEETFSHNQSTTRGLVLFSYYSVCAASMFFGLMLGFAVLGNLMDHIGRKETGLTTMVVNSGGVIFVLLITPFCTPILLGSEDLWFIVPCSCIILATLHLSIAVFFPQSPKQLYIQKHDEDGTRKALEFYLGENCNTKKILNEYEAEKSLESDTFLSLLDVLRDSIYRSTFFLVLICSFVPVFSAVNIKSQYLSSILIGYGLTQAEHYSLCWMFAVFGCVFGQIAVNMGLLILSPLMISEICEHKTTAVVSQFTQVVPIMFAVVEVFMFPNLQEIFGASLFFFTPVAV
uniref:MFS domain-containing protein n=1 Tax=Heterorhabditis bacteriophora TaxID=37862 RepID=A0A1I7X4W4_HETBA